MRSKEVLGRYNSFQELINMSATKRNLLGSRYVTITYTYIYIYPHINLFTSIYSIKTICYGASVKKKLKVSYTILGNIEIVVIQNRYLCLN